jgi:hypothetical protein
MSIVEAGTRCTDRWAENVNLARRRSRKNVSLNCWNIYQLLRNYAGIKAFFPAVMPKWVSDAEPWMKIIFAVNETFAGADSSIPVQPGIWAVPGNPEDRN